MILNSASREKKAEDTETEVKDGGNTIVRYKYWRTKMKEETAWVRATFEKMI